MSTVQEIEAAITRLEPKKIHAAADSPGSSFPLRMPPTLLDFPSR
jgi:hypothetical protein